MSDRIQSIGVVGQGALGRALTMSLMRAGQSIQVWSRRASQAPHVENGQWEQVAELADLVRACRLVIWTSPANQLQEIVASIAPEARGDHYWVHCAKGSDAQGRLGHEIIRANTAVRQIGVLGGPILAEDLASHGPGGLLIASRFDVVTKTLLAAFHQDQQRVFVSRDLVGVELAGAMRNVLSVASGLAHAHSEAARSELLARGLVETARLGLALGADPQTFVGVAGVGDLIARREAKSSRNFALGQLCAQGVPAQKALQELDNVEGAVSASALSQRAHALGVMTPIADGVARVLAGKIIGGEMLSTLLQSDPGLGLRDGLVSSGP